MQTDYNNNEEYRYSLLYLKVYSVLQSFEVVQLILIVLCGWLIT